MLHTKFAVIYRNLWSRIKLIDSNKFERNSNWKSHTFEIKSASKCRTRKPVCLRNLSYAEKTDNGRFLNRDLIRMSPVCQRVAFRFHFRNTSSSIHHLLEHWKRPQLERYYLQSKKPWFSLLRRKWSLTGSNAWKKSNQRWQSEWVGDEMKNEIMKEAPGTHRSTIDSYEAGRMTSKEKCTDKSRGVIRDRPRRMPQIPMNCRNEDEEEDRSRNCAPETKECEEEEDECQNASGGRLCPPSSDVVQDKKKKSSLFNIASIGSETLRKKYGFPSSNSSSSSLAVSSQPKRSQKQSVRPPSLCCPPPAKSPSSNSLSRSRSSSCPPPPPSSSQSCNNNKCPTLPTGPVACRKPCPPPPPPCPPPPCPPPPCPPPPPPCPPPPCPPPKSRCGPPPCPPPPCPPPCPPPPPPPCSPPPSSPKMEALQFDPICKVLNFYLLNAPTSIRKDEVLVQIVYSGACSTDLAIMAGKYPVKNCPVILGHEFSGIACAVGSGVSHIKCGDCIAVNPYSACHVCKYCARGQTGACSTEGLHNVLGIHKDGAWAEFVVVHKSQVFTIPPCLSLAQAVLLKTISCILNAMTKMRIPLGANVIIMGTGLSGCLWASVLHSQGYRNVIACDISEYKRKLLQCLDLKYCVLPPEKMTEVKGDVVIDCTRIAKTVERDICMLNTQGKLCLFGMPAADESAEIPVSEIAKRELKIISCITNTNCFSGALSIAEAMGCRYLDYEKLGMQTFKLGQFEGAFKMKKAGEINKVVFKIQGSK